MPNRRALGKPWMSEAAFSNLAWAGCQLRARITGLATERCAPVPQVDNREAQRERPALTTMTQHAHGGRRRAEYRSGGRSACVGIGCGRSASPTPLTWDMASVGSCEGCGSGPTRSTSAPTVQWRRGRIRDSRVEPSQCARMGSNAPTAAEVAAKLNSPQSSETPLPRHIPTAIKACPPSPCRSVG